MVDFVRWHDARFIGRVRSWPRLVFWRLAFSAVNTAVGQERRPLPATIYRIAWKACSHAGISVGTLGDPGRRSQNRPNDL